MSLSLGQTTIQLLNKSVSHATNYLAIVYFFIMTKTTVMTMIIVNLVLLSGVDGLTLCVFADKQVL